ATAVAAVRELAQRRVLEERRVAEHERLQQLGLVAASLAHEIKNPLSAIKAITQGVRTDLADERTVRDDDLADLDLIVEQIDRLDRVARDILGFARPSQGTTTDLTQLTRSAITVLEAEAKKRAVTLTSQIADDVTVFGGVAAWQTITFNLVLNAVEHSRAGDTVSVHLTGADVTDTHDTDTHGTGADDEAVLTTTNPGTLADPETIFEAFDSDGGIGLGLALVARRVAECNARIEVEHHDDEIRFTVTARTATPPTEMS
ncbi:MAG: HAMP domain-containing sensor histidine kinase, partial [Acidobacteriota bacterium]